MTARRGQGESSIYRDADGTWHGYVSLGRKDGGRRDRRHVSAARRADVVAKVRELERKRDAGLVESAGRAPTVAAWLQHWVDNIAAPRVSVRTLQSYRDTIRLHLNPALGHHRLDRLQPEHVERLYRDLADRGLAPSSVLRTHRVLHRALKVALQRGRVARNVATLVDAPSVSRPEIDPLRADEARRVLDAASNDRNGARWSVALALGLRQGEALDDRFQAIFSGRRPRGTV